MPSGFRGGPVRSLKPLSFAPGSFRSAFGASGQADLASKPYNALTPQISPSRPSACLRARIPGEALPRAGQGAAPPCFRQTRNCALRPGTGEGAPLDASPERADARP